MKKLRNWTFKRYSSSPPGRTSWAIYLTGWVFFTNHSYPGEQKYFIRLFNWRKNFGGIRP